MRDRLPVLRSALALAGFLLLLSFGLPWERTPATPGTGHLMRVTSLFAVLLLWQAVRRGSRSLAGRALAVAAVALPFGLGQGAAEPGRLCYLGAMAAAALAVGLLPFPRTGAVEVSGSP